jgi:hypothetical protein
MNEYMHHHEKKGKMCIEEKSASGKGKHTNRK